MSIADQPAPTLGAAQLNLAGSTLPDRLAAPNNQLSVRMAHIHRRFHGRWSAVTLALGLAINLGGLMGLSKIALGL